MSNTQAGTLLLRRSDLEGTVVSIVGQVGVACCEAEQFVDASGMTNAHPSLAKLPSHYPPPCTSQRHSADTEGLRHCKTKNVTRENKRVLVKSVSIDQLSKRSIEASSFLATQTSFNPISLKAQSCSPTVLQVPGVICGSFPFHPKYKGEVVTLLMTIHC